MNLITHSKPCLRHQFDLPTATVLAQRIAKYLPVVSAKSEGAEEAGLARTITVIWIEQIIENLFSLDQQPFYKRKNQLHGCR